MDRRNEQQFIDRMHNIVEGLTRSCKVCLHKGVSCQRCWSSEAKYLLADMNTYQTPESLAEKTDLNDETSYVLELVNSHLGITIKMLSSSLENLKEHSIQFIVRKLLKSNKIASSNGSPKVYFAAGTPVDAITSISQTFRKTRKAKHGKG